MSIFQKKSKDQKDDHFQQSPIPQPSTKKPQAIPIQINPYENQTLLAGKLGDFPNNKEEEQEKKEEKKEDKKEKETVDHDVTKIETEYAQIMKLNINEKLNNEE